MSLETSVTINSQIKQESLNRSTTSCPSNSENLETSVNENESNTDVLNQTKMYKCKQCVFICVNKEDYWLHQRHVHIKPEKLLECSKCQFVTEYKHHLEYHLRNHMGSKPYKCSQCEYACVNLSMLRSHLKSHSKAIQYNCAECSYSTKYYNSLKAHMDKFSHTCSNSTKNTMHAASMIMNMNNGKNKNSHQEPLQKTSSSSNSSTCSSSSFDASVQSKQKQSKTNKPLDLYQNDGSVTSSNSPVTSASSSQSSSPNWASQLTINPNTLPTKMSSNLSPKFDSAAAITAAALAYQTQQQQQQAIPNFLLNPSLLFNNLGSMIPNQQSDITNSPNSYNNQNSDDNSNPSNENNIQLNIIQQQQQQLQLMVLAMAASSNNFQTNQTKNTPISNIFNDLYQHQQKSQQEQLLLATSILQQQQQALQSTSNKREREESPNHHEIESNKKPYIENHAASKNFNCEICKLNFESKKDLKRHNKLSHTGDTTQEYLDESSVSQLHECYKCELIFRKYEMFCAHKMLHDIQDKKLKTEPDKNNNVNSVQNQEASHDELNNFLVKKFFSEQIQQNLIESSQASKDKFNCNQCGSNFDNSLQFFIHVQTFHNLNSTNDLSSNTRNQDHIKQET